MRPRACGFLTERAAADDVVGSGAAAANELHGDVIMRLLRKPFFWLAAAVATFLLVQFALALVDELPKLIEELK